MLESITIQNIKLWSGNDIHTYTRLMGDSKNIRHCLSAHDVKCIEEYEWKVAVDELTPVETDGVSKLFQETVKLVREHSAPEA
jgi:hypothetical protein